MKERISLQELIAVNNPSKARALVVKYGFRPARNTNDLIYKLFRITKDNGEEGLKDLAQIHPHKDLLDWDKNDKSSFSSCCGTTSSFNGDSYSNACGCQHSNCDGDNKCSACKENERKSNTIADDYIDVTGNTQQSPMAKLSDKAVDMIPIVLLAGLFAFTFKAISGGK